MERLIRKERWEESISSKVSRVKGDVSEHLISRTNFSFIIQVKSKREVIERWRGTSCSIQGMQDALVCEQNEGLRPVLFDWNFLLQRNRIISSFLSTQNENLIAMNRRIRTTHLLKCLSCEFE